MEALVLFLIGLLLLVQRLPEIWSCLCKGIAELRASLDWHREEITAAGAAELARRLAAALGLLLLMALCLLAPIR
jgi:hypothetical protein